jgi:hypothetical protein
MSRFLNGLSNFQMNSGVRADGLSANDLQRQLNRIVPPQPVPQPLPFAGLPERRDSNLFFQQNDPAFLQEQAKLQSAFDERFDEMPAGPALTAKAPQQQFAEGYGPQVQMASPQQQMLSQMQNRGFSSPQPQQQIQPAPQQQIAGGYGLTGAYQGDQFSRGVMSLPQIQDNFYSPPAGGYTAPPITSPYSMF